MREMATDEEKQQWLYQILEDTTRWDKMSGVELKRRITKFMKSNGSGDLTSVVSCLRLADLVFLYNEVDGQQTLPFLETPQGQVLLVFTSKSQIKNERLKEFKTMSHNFASLLANLTQKPKQVVINPDTQCFPLEADTVYKMMSAMDDIEAYIDDLMEKGFDAENLDAIMFERFFGRRIECKTINGTLIGDASEYTVDEKGVPYLLVEVDEDKKEKLYQADVISIKEILPSDEL